MKIILYLVIILLHQPGFALHLGTYGETFNIIEPDLLAVIHRKLKNLANSGQLLSDQTTMQNKLAAKVNKPAAISGLVKTKVAKVFWYDPSIKVPYDLTDQQGNIFAKNGTVINPLATHKLQQALLFIDGTCQAQVKWAVNYPKPHKIILVNGSCLELFKQFKVTCYFDQNGSLVKKFDLQQVPATVTQDGKKLKIEEVALDD